MAQSLTAFIDETGDLPFVWGERDCTLWVADWWLARHGEDPAADFRNRYSTQSEADAFVAGDLVALIDRYVPRKPVAERGDIGVIEVFGQRVAAICAGDFWVLKSEAGCLAVRRDPLAVWGL